MPPLSSPSERAQATAHQHELLFTEATHAVAQAMNHTPLTGENTVQFSVPSTKEMLDVHYAANKRVGQFPVQSIVFFQPGWEVKTFQSTRERGDTRFVVTTDSVTQLGRHDGEDVTLFDAATGEFPKGIGPRRQVRALQVLCNMREILTNEKPLN